MMIPKAEYAIKKEKDSLFNIYHKKQLFMIQFHFKWHMMNTLECQSHILFLLSQMQFYA